tara:strand:+ start:1011 stop:1853 length:843 start_codon:yes stop_codon:yes gene_type:complete
MIFKVNNFIIVFLLLFLISCGKEKQEISKITETNIQLQMIEAYQDGLEALEDGDVILASKKFNEAELLFPQSEWAPRSVLMSAYSFYSQDYYTDSIFELERFISTYPKNKNMAYAHFLLGMCYYEQIVDEKKDLGSVLKAKNKFNFIITEYPETDFAVDAKYKVDLINDILASKEMYVGRYYLQRKKWIPSINRFKKVIDEYQTTIYVEEALHRLVEVHYKIGLIDESQKYAKLLGYNYQSSEWYKKSYIIFNTNYEDSKKKIKKEKKNIIFKKLKNLFD